MEEKEIQEMIKENENLKKTIEDNKISLQKSTDNYNNLLKQKEDIDKKYAENDILLKVEQGINAKWGELVETNTKEPLKEEEKFISKYRKGKTNNE